MIPILQGWAQARTDAKVPCPIDVHSFDQFRSIIKTSAERHTLSDKDGPFEVPI